MNCGVCFGLIVFLELWRTIFFEEFAGGWGAVIAGIILILIFMIVDRYIEVWARKTYGPYTEEKTEEAA